MFCWLVQLVPIIFYKLIKQCLIKSAELLSTSAEKQYYKYINPKELSWMIYWMIMYTVRTVDDGPLNTLYLDLVLFPPPLVVSLFVILVFAHDGVCDMNRYIN